MIEALTSEYVIGLIVGLLLSLAGARYQTYLTDRQQKRSAQEVVRDFSVDIIQNLQSTIKELDDTRDRAHAIHHDYLNMIDNQVTVFDRNAEHLCRLPTELRNEVRRYVTTISIRKASIAFHLDNYYKFTQLAEQIRTQGRGPEAERIKADALLPLSEAQKVADKLAQYATQGDAIIKKLTSYTP